LSKARELAKRAVCGANLAGNGKAIAMYANVARGNFPQASKARVHRTENANMPTKVPVPNPDGMQGAAAEGYASYVFFFDYAALPQQSGTWDPANGLHRWQAVVLERNATDKARIANTAKDTACSFPTRELFLLVKGSFSQANQFTCPSTAHEGDDLRGDQRVAGETSHDGVKSPTTGLGLNNNTDIVPPALLWDFLIPDNMDYGYMFGHDNDAETLNESMDPQYPLIADSNPYFRKMVNGEGITPTDDAPRGWLASIVSKKMGDNSPNHLTEGQNVLYGDLHAFFYDHPTVGVGTDNIYTWHFSIANNGAPKPQDRAPGILSARRADYQFDLVSKTDAIMMP
jgi:hypothetical protein